MTTNEQGRIGASFARLSTGLKMLLILSAALLPLGLVAILATLHSAQQKDDQRRAETVARLEIKAQRLNAAFSRSVLTLRTASAAIAAAPSVPDVCGKTLAQLEQDPVEARYALYAGSPLPRCQSRGFVPLASVAPARGPGVRAEIVPGGGALRLFVYGGGGALQGVAEYPASALSVLSYIPGTSRNFDLALSQPGRVMKLREAYQGGAFVRTVRRSEPVAGGQLTLSLALGARPIGAVDLLMILLPVLMWLAAAAIGWLILNSYLLRPLAKLQRAVSTYRPGDRDIGIPPLATPAREIGELGGAFDTVVRTVARHEAELEAAVDRQTRLVREVHHRVKNNLQVVASLLNLHARGSPNEQVSAAYASIQRRVDALAVVHRNHYAELEENRGVALKPLISELAANLRGTAPQSAAGMAIRLDLESYYATQDVAVSVAFLITELVEYAMLCGAASVAIALGGESGASTATLSVETDTLKGDVTCDPALTERFERIVTGLSRQLRTTLARDTDEGRYSLAIAVVEKAERR
ncbi:MAG: sensor histidine kinase [Alphaproteobacteria bacterium]|nr:sensor histidine kinase [Alphaproteobacteria bacterium]MBV9372161.1 sensor histidine kinase [Alphaproteobacteria bacterium]